MTEIAFDGGSRSYHDDRRPKEAAVVSYVCPSRAPYFFVVVAVNSSATHSDKVLGSWGGVSTQETKNNDCLFAMRARAHILCVCF